MAEDNGRAFRKAHGKGPGRAAGKRQSRRKRGAAKLAARLQARVAAEPASARASPSPRLRMQRKLPARTAGTPRAGLVALRRKPRAAAPVTEACKRGVAVRALPRESLPLVLRCAGRKRSAPRPSRVRPGVPEAGLPRCGQEVALPVVPAAATWALPLPVREEPLVEAAVRAEPAIASPDLAPLARNRAPVPWRDGVVAQMEAWLRSAAERLGRLVRSGPGQRHRAPAAARRMPPMAPAIARANREIGALRRENARLRREIAALERLRGPAAAAPTTRRMTGVVEA